MAKEAPVVNMRPGGPGGPGGRRGGPPGMMPGEKPKNLRATLSRILTYIGKNRRLIIAMLAVMLVATLLNVIAPTIQANAIDSIAKLDANALVTWLVVLGAVYLCSAVFTYFQNLFAAMLSQYTVRVMRKDLFARISRLPIKYMDTHKHGDILSRMTNDVENVSNSVSQSLGSLISGVIMLIGCFVMMLIHSWLMTIVSMVTIVLTLLVTKFLSKFMRKYFPLQQAKLGQLNGQIDNTQAQINVLTDKITLLEDKYDAKAITGTLTKVKQDNGKSTYNITIENAKYNGGTYNGGTVSYTDVSKDYSDLLYQNVRVLVKPDKNGKDAVVYGVYATGKNTVQTGLLADLKMDGTKAKLDGTKYDLANTNTVYVDGVKQSDNIKTWLTTNGEGNATYGKGSEVELLAVDGTSDYSILKVTTFEVKEITYVGSDYVTAGTKYSDDDYVISDGLKKGDYALISKGSNYADSKGRIEKATVVEGKVTSTKGSDEVMIDGTWYTMNTGVTAPKLNASAKLVLVNGYVYAVDTVTAGSSDVALVVEVGNSNTVGSKYYQARLILADGTDKVVNIEKNDGNDQALDSKNFAGYSNKLAAYDVSKDVYTLTFITTDSSQTDMAGYENFYYTSSATIDGSVRSASKFNAAAANKEKNDVSRAYFDDNATVFVKYKNDDYKVVTGEAARKWDEITPSMVRMLTEEKSNSQYIGVAYVDLGDKNVPGGSDKTYAVALDDSYTSKIDGTTYTIVKAWNGTEETEYKYEGTLSGGITKGSVFEYSSNGDGTVDIDKLTATTTQVKTYDKGSGEITFADTVTNLTGSNAKIDAKDTTVLFVDSDAATGETNGEIQLAPEFNGDATNHDDNVTVYVDSGDDCITLIVVDVQNKMAW